IVRSCRKLQLDRSDDRATVRKEMKMLGADFFVSPEVLLRGRKYLLRSIAYDKDEEAAAFEVEIGDEKGFSTDALEGVGHLVATLAAKKSREVADPQAGYELITRIASIEVVAGPRAVCVIELARGTIARRLPSENGWRGFENAIEHFTSAKK